MAFPACPTAPTWEIPWHLLDPEPWMEQLRGCPQHPIRHAEGDVWTHVHMVCEAMAAMPSFRALNKEEQQILFTCALLHDVAKPICTRVGLHGEVSAKGHAWRGAIKARAILWKLGVPFQAREMVCGMIRHHLVPFFLTESPDPLRLAYEVSQTARCDWLALQAEADARGRVCPNPDNLLAQIKAFRDYTEQVGCLTKPCEFPTDHARLSFFRQEKEIQKSPPRAEVILMSGLPSAGKDHWIAHSLPDHPVISLDHIREQLGVLPTDPQGEVITIARDLARGYFRAGRSFIWNATNLSRTTRTECVNFFRDFGAKVKIVYVEASPAQLYLQNRERRKRVPEKVIERLLDRWEIPDPTEAHSVEYVVAGQ